MPHLYIVAKPYLTTLFQHLHLCRNSSILSKWHSSLRTPCAFPTMVCVTSVAIPHSLKHPLQHVTLMQHRGTEEAVRWKRIVDKATCLAYSKEIYNESRKAEERYVWSGIGCQKTIIYTRRGRASNYYEKIRISKPGTIEVTLDAPVLRPVLPG